METPGLHFCNNFFQRVIICFPGLAPLQKLHVSRFYQFHLSEAPELYLPVSPKCFLRLDSDLYNLYFFTLRSKLSFSLQRLKHKLSDLASAYLSKSIAD